MGEIQGGCKESVRERFWKGLRKFGREGGTVVLEGVRHGEISGGPV